MMPTSTSRLVLATPLAGCVLLFACRSAQVADDPAAHPADGAPSVTVSARSLPAVPPPLAPVSGTTYEAAAKLELPAPEPENHPTLHNVFHLSDDVISGGEPDSEEAFRILQAKGVATILSVDGKVPDAELASKYGMTYVHVPIQYKGITDDQVEKITKTFREQPGPFYVHCFHGQHRGPAAAELGRLVLDGIPRERALAEMRQWCGTSSSYEGLYETVAYADIPTEHETGELDWDFPAAAPLEGVAGAMVDIARSNDHLKAASKNGWQPPENHPDLNALNEATMLASLFERTSALDEVARSAEDYRNWMRDAALRSNELREAVSALGSGGSKDAADTALKALGATCKACHNAYRN